MGQELAVKPGQYWQFPTGELVYVDGMSETHWYGTVTVEGFTTTVRGPVEKLVGFVEVATLLGTQPVENGAAKKDSSNVHEIKPN